MVRLTNFEPFTIYKAVPPIIMPESAKNKKKGQAYIVLAPTIEDELKFMSETNILSFRYLTKYFVEKLWEVNLHGMGSRKIKPVDELEIDKLLTQYTRGALREVSGVTSFKANCTADVLKGFNVLMEVNHVTEIIMKNPKDKRRVRDKVPELYKELCRVINLKYNKLGDYNRTVIIPMNLWFTQAEYTNGAKTLRSISTNLMGVLLRLLCVPENLANFGTVVLVDRNLVMVMSAGDKTLTEEFIYKMLIKYMGMAKKIKHTNVISAAEISSEESVAYTGDTEAEEAVPDEKKTYDIKKASEDTAAEIRSEKVLAAVKVDPDSVDPEVKEKVKAVAKNAAKRNDGGGAPVVNVPEESKETDGSLTIDTPNLELQDSGEVDTILAAKMNGKSVSSQQRDEMLKEKYKDLKLGSTPMKDLVEEAEHLEVPDVKVRANTVNESFKSIRAHQFEKTYKENLMQHHLVSILTHFGTVTPALYLNKDIQIEDVSSHTNRVLRYTVEYEDENRKRHRFSFKLPKMYKDKYLYLNGQELNITHQKLPFPITKVQPDRCQLVTNYNKLFVYRYGAALSPRIIKLKKLLSSNTMRSVAITKGDCTILNKSELTSLEFDELAGSFVKIKIGSISESMTFLFDINDARAIIPDNEIPKNLHDFEGNSIEDNNLVPLAIYRSKGKRVPYWLSGTSNHVYDNTGSDMGELSSFIIDKLVEAEPSLKDELASTSSGTKYIYSRVHIMDREIPLIIVMGAADPDGLLGALEKSKVPYQFVEKRPTVDKDKTGVIPFSDGYLVYDRYPFENSLLLNGLQAVPTKEYSFYEMGSRDTYVDIFDLMCNQRTLADNMGGFYYMMVDPITKDVLVRLGMPTDFTTLLCYCNGVLADNNYQIDSDYNNSRIRSTEIIMAHLYRHLAVAWSNYRSGRTDTFSIPEDAIIKELLTSKIVDPKSKLNINLELENDRNVKLKGPSGMNEDHSFTIEKRAYHSTMRGVVATNSVPSGEVGINRHLTTNAHIDDALGFITINQGEYDGSELLSPAELLSPFGPESADIERLCMTISQAKHLVPVESQCSCPVSYDFERVAPYLSNDFAFVSKKAGKVVEISEDLMIVKYDDGTVDDVDLSEHPVKNTDGGFFIMNKMETKHKVGDRFQAGEILAFDKKVINDLDFFGDPCANVGTLARVAFESNGCVFEDSGYITDSFAHRFAAKVTREKKVILSPYANIKYMVKVGQKVQANDPILAFDDTEDEFSSQLLASMADQAEDADVITATTAPVISKYTGVIKDIKIIYTIPLDAMTESMRKIVEQYSRDSAKREKVIHKYMDIRDANTIAKNSEMSVPDSSGKVGGSKIGDGVEISFYIEYIDVAGNGDKGSIGALKFTDCAVIPDELAGYTESNEERKIDAYVSSLGAFKRMVADVEKIGVLTKVLVEEKRRIKEMFGARIKAELKKK